MYNKMPRTPLSTPLSGSARETELRLKNIFSGPKKRPPILFLVLMCAVCLLCGNLVSCQTRPVEEPDASDSSRQGDASPAEPAPDLKPDLNQNGVPEEARLVEAYGDVEVQFWEGEELIDREQPGVCLYRSGGTDFILRYSLDEYQGSFHYYYSVSDFSGEFEDAFLWNRVTFDTNFNTLFHKNFDPEEIAVFMDELNELLTHSIRLSNLDGELVMEYDLFEDLPWLDEHPDVFTRDPEKPLLENLEAFQAAMPADLSIPDPQPGASLPISQPLKMIFLSGAGAWCTDLTLNPDGSFVGDYHDADGAIYYTCQFHGRFGTIVQLTDSSWYMTLEELVLDTRYPVGEEWDEVPDWLDGPLHFISSEPNGFNGEDGKALEPGAGFILYAPDATGHAPGTELYGAEEFWTWWPNRHVLYSAADTLGCYGLHNLETGHGFFSY